MKTPNWNFEWEHWSGRVFLGWTSTKQGLMCLAQGHNTVPWVRLEPATPYSRVKHSATEPLRYLPEPWAQASQSEVLWCSDVRSSQSVIRYSTICFKQHLLNCWLVIHWTSQEWALRWYVLLQSCSNILIPTCSSLNTKSFFGSAVAQW